MMLSSTMKPALVPLLSYMGPAIAGVLTGSVVVEQVFGIPGVGSLFHFRVPLLPARYADGDVERQVVLEVVVLRRNTVHEHAHQLRRAEVGVLNGARVQNFQVAPGQDDRERGRGRNPGLSDPVSH